MIYCYTMRSVLKKIVIPSEIRLLQQIKTPRHNQFPTNTKITSFDIFLVAFIPNCGILLLRFGRPLSHSLSHQDIN